MTRVDLADLQHKLNMNLSLDDGPEYQAVGAVVAELRAAREVVEATRRWTTGQYGSLNALYASVKDKVAAYDEAVGS